MNNIKSIIITIDTNPKKISKSENARLQKKHDREMAAKFGFYSFKKMNEYLKLCNCNTEWFEANGGSYGVLNNPELITKFLKNKGEFVSDIIKYKKDEINHWPFFFFNGKFMNNPNG